MTNFVAFIPLFGESSSERAQKATRMQQEQDEVAPQKVEEESNIECIIIRVNNAQASCL